MMRQLTIQLRVNMLIFVGCFDHSKAARGCLSLSFYIWRICELSLHYSINLAFDDQSPAKHEEIANCIKAGEATEGQLMVQKGLKNTKMRGGFSSPVFLVESGFITIDVYLQTLYKHITVRWCPLPSNNHHQDCLRCCWLGDYPKVYTWHVNIYTYVSISTIVNQQVCWISEPLIA